MGVEVAGVGGGNLVCTTESFSREGARRSLSRERGRDKRKKGYGEEKKRNERPGRHTLSADIAEESR